MQKICFIDTETTGCDEKIHHIWQIAIRITDTSLNPIDSLKLTFRPYSAAMMDQEAIDKHGMSSEQMEAFPMGHKDAFTAMLAFFNKHVKRYDKTDKMIFAGYNSGFDNRFIRRFFQLNDDSWYGSYFWSPDMCVMQSSMLLFHSVRMSMHNFKLETLCKLAGLGWSEEDAHDAEYDIIKTIELYRYILETLGYEFTPPTA